MRLAAIRAHEQNPPLLPFLQHRHECGVVIALDNKDIGLKVPQRWQQKINISMPVLCLGNFLSSTDGFAIAADPFMHNLFGTAEYFQRVRHHLGVCGRRLTVGKVFVDAVSRRYNLHVVLPQLIGQDTRCHRILFDDGFNSLVSQRGRFFQQRDKLPVGKLKFN